MITRRYCKYMYGNEKGSPSTSLCLHRYSRGTLSPSLSLPAVSIARKHRGLSLRSDRASGRTSDTVADLNAAANPRKHSPPSYSPLRIISIGSAN